MTTAAPAASTTLPIASIAVKQNIRKTFDESRLKELAASIKDKGLINPITVRPLSAGKFELVAGERRLRAAKLAGLTSIQATVRTLSDQEALELQTAENIHRQDLTPIEEARGFQLLTQSGKYTVEQLAELVDKSAAYVYRSMRLLELPAAILAEIEAGDLTPAHGHQLLRVPAEKREEVFEQWNSDAYTSDDSYESAQALGTYISRSCARRLSEAPFPKDKPYAEQQACAVCPYNTGNQGMLFDGAENGKCTSRDCYDKKAAAYWDAAQEKARAHAQKYGMQWLGESMGQGYGDERTFKGMTITEDKKATNPEKHAVGWLLPAKYSNEKPQMVIVLLKTPEQKKAEVEQRIKKDRSNPNGQRAQFIEAAAKKAEVEQLVAARPKMSDEVLKEVVILAMDGYEYSHEGHDEVVEYLCGKDGNMRDRKLTRQELETLAVVASREWEDVVKLLKLDSKAARKAAAAKWDKKAQEAAAAAKAVGKKKAA